MNRRPRTALEPIAVAALLVLFAVLSGWGLFADASVADEHPHILCGLLFWRSGHFSGGLDNPPLGQLLLAAPLALLHRDYAFPSDTDLALCRLPVLCLGLGLGVLVWRWGRALGGRAAGLGALTAYALEPNLLAHAHLATLDFPVTALWWGSLWAWRMLLRRDAASAGAGRQATVAFALLFAAAVLTKFSALCLVPGLCLTALAVGRDLGAWRRALVALVLGLGTCVLLAHVGYGFEPVRDGLPEKLVEGLRGKLVHRDEVRFAYLAGRRSESGFLSYYIVAMLLKTPLPLLSTAAWGSWLLLRRRPARLDWALLVVPAALLVAACSFIRVNVGVRHVLPAYPALCVLAGTGAAALFGGGRLQRALLVALTAALGVGVGRVAPQWLAYFNALAGGAPGGHRWLLDSNLDWGQDDGRLAHRLAAAAQAGTPYVVDPDPLVPRTGRIAVSANALHNLQRRSERPYAWLRDLAPQGFAGYSWRLYALAPSDFEAQAAARPQDAVAAWANAEVARATGDSARAEALLDEARARLRAPQDRVELAALAAHAAMRRGDRVRARQWIESGLALEPRDPELSQLGQETQLETQADASPDAEVRGRAALELGLQRAESGRVADAMPLLARAAAALPSDLEAQRAVGIGYARMGDWRRAVEWLERPGLADSLRQESEFCRALAATQDAVQNGGGDPDPDLLSELGRAHFESNRYDAASAAFLRLLAVRPDDRLAVTHLGEMQVRSKMRVVEERLEPRRVWLGRTPATLR